MRDIADILDQEDAEKHPVTETMGEGFAFLAWHNYWYGLNCTCTRHRSCHRMWQTGQR